MLVAVFRESNRSECRVAASPQAVEKIIKLGYEVQIERGCGERANFPDEQYVESGATIAGEPAELRAQADVILTVNPPAASHLERIRSGAALIGFLWPAQNESLLETLRQKKVSALAMDCIPRITRAQKMDALSSMANIAGYRAVIEAAEHFGRFFTGQMTAAGKVPPAKVMVIGAGVAGLSAIGTARGLGAIVRAFDTREAARDQVKSMGAEFLELEFEESGEGAGGYAKVMSEEFIRAEMELFARQAMEVDIIITTALIPGKPAPRLITAGMVGSMRPGSVVVDLAAANGGNCELTQPGEVVREHGVTIIGYSDLPSRLPTQSSTLYANNIVNLLTDMTPDRDGQLAVDMEDQVVRGALVTHAGEITWPPPEIEPSPVEVSSGPETPQSVQLADSVKPDAHPWKPWIALAAVLSLLVLIGFAVPAGFVSQLTVFALACLIGWQVIWNVTPALHTPLMSVTNAISGIIIIGALLQMVSGWSWTSVLAFLAVLVSMINISGGFFVTHRMLGMFRKQD